MSFANGGRLDRLEPTLSDMEDKGIMADLRMYDLLADICNKYGLLKFSVTCLLNMHDRHVVAPRIMSGPCVCSSRQLVPGPKVWHAGPVGWGASC